MESLHRVGATGTANSEEIAGTRRRLRLRGLVGDRRETGEAPGLGRVSGRLLTTSECET